MRQRALLVQQTETQDKPVLTQQLERFLIVGFTTVAIDFAFYRVLLLVDFQTEAAKAIAFIIGTIFAYFANRLWTFNRAKGGRSVFAMFVGLYVTTLIINVAANSGVLAVFGESEFALSLGFLMATGTSATLNFIGMRMIVFRSKQRADSK